MGRHGLIFALAAAIILVSCVSRKPAYVAKPTRSLANADSDKPEIQAVVFHSSDTMSELYLKISNANLLYRRPDTSKAFYAELRVRFVLYGEKKKLVDSGSVRLLDRAPEEGVSARDLFSNFNLGARRALNYQLEVELSDLNRHATYSKIINVYKTQNRGAQNFLVRKNDSLAFTNKFPSGTSIQVFYPHDRPFMYVEWFTKEFGPALPPFSLKPADETKYKPDSSFSVMVHNRLFGLEMPPSGFCHVRPSNEEPEGLTLFTVDPSFPGVGSSLEMIQCTRYIMFREEFEKCRDAPDRKAAIDEFWLNIGGSQERAKELLKRYYGRVKEANRAYSNYTQGWKSDRGMIYIVMGPPASVFKNRKGEVWVYGNDANPNALRFVFNKTENPYSDNDYILERSVLYKDPYHTAVEFWRQGMVYFDSGR